MRSASERRRRAFFARFFASAFAAHPILTHAQEQKSKEAKALAAANSSKGKRKKWSKGKQK